MPKVLAGRDHLARFALQRSGVARDATVLIDLDLHLPVKKLGQLALTHAAINEITQPHTYYQASRRR
jgi:hypothetical protein